MEKLNAINKEIKDFEELKKELENALNLLYENKKKIEDDLNKEPEIGDFKHIVFYNETVYNETPEKIEIIPNEQTKTLQTNLNRIFRAYSKPVHLSGKDNKWIQNIDYKGNILHFPEDKKVKVLNKR